MVKSGLWFQSPQKSLSVPKSCLVLPKVALQSQKSFRHAPTKIACLDLLPWRLLAWACFSRGHWLRPSPIEVVDLGLLPWMSLAWTCSSGGRWPGPGPIEVAGLSLLLGGHWLNPGPTEVAGSGLLPERWLPCTCTSEVCSWGGHWFGPAFADVPGLGLLQRRSLAWAWSRGVHWFGPAPMELACSGRWSYLFKPGCSPTPRNLPDPALPHLVLGLIVASSCQAASSWCPTTHKHLNSY